MIDPMIAFHPQSTSQLDRNMAWIRNSKQTESLYRKWIPAKRKCWTGHCHRHRWRNCKLCLYASYSVTTFPEWCFNIHKVSSHTVHSYAGVSFPWWPFLTHICPSATNQILIHCPSVCGKMIVHKVPPINIQKLFWALYVIRKSRWYTTNSFDKTKISNLTFCTLIFPCKYFSSYNIRFPQIKVICVLRLVHAHIVGTQQFLYSIENPLSTT